ncbi:MAG: phospho-N-acetylmuramoyl-pentapeptide-transferase [Peptostreptococcaceae bacterium]|nr:phospho-N-acetylmuramoyl-pentapeptide-transferase [Peptostreptococcaceae bacterium]
MHSIFVQFLITLLATIIAGQIMIPYLKKIKVGQSIREDGPSSHLMKSGTPTIGGLIFICPVVLAYFVFGETENAGLKILISGYILFALIGFIDDYLKVVKKRNLGLRAYQKLAMQSVVAAFVVFWLYKSGLTDNRLLVHSVGASIDMGWLKVPFLMVFILATVNSVNLTDGLDGLATSVTIIVSLLFLFYGEQIGMDGFTQVIVFFVASLLGFLFFNKKPAKVFMGDTGSLALGAYVGIAAILLRIELMLLLYGFIYFMESLSVIIQVISFKTRKKRVFRMSPIHHHFELVGWSERKVVVVFTAVTVWAVLVSGWILSKGAII